MNLNEALNLLKEQGYLYNKYTLAPVLDLLNEDQKDQVNNFKKQINSIAASALKLKRQKQTDDVKKKEKELASNSFGLLSKIRNNKWSKRAYTALRILSVAAGVLGAPVSTMEDGTIEFDTDHGSYEISNDGIQYLDGEGNTVFTYNPDNGNANFAIELNDKQLDAINADLNSTVKNVANDSEINLSNVTIHSDNEEDFDTKSLDNLKTKHDLHKSLFDFDDIEDFEKVHNMKQKLGLDDVNDVEFVHLTDPDYMPSDDEVDRMSPEEKELYMSTHNMMHDFVKDDETSIKDQLAFDRTVQVQGGHISFTQEADGLEQMQKYMKSHHHETNDAEPYHEQYMRAYLTDHGISQDKVDDMEGKELYNAYSKVYNRVNIATDSDGTMQVAANFLDDEK